MTVQSAHILSEYVFFSFKILKFFQKTIDFFENILYNSIHKILVANVLWYLLGIATNFNRQNNNFGNNLA